MTTKDIRQQQGVRLSMFKSGILHYPPGFGKTKIGIGIAQTYRVTVPVVRIAILVHNQITKAQWEQEALLAGINVRIRTIEEVINSYTGNSYGTDILIIDEVHKYLTDIRFPFINGDKIHYGYAIGLTATIPSDKIDRTKLLNLLPIIDAISIKEAVTNEWIAKHIEINYGLDFNNDDKDLYIQLSRPISNVLDLFKGMYKRMPLPGLHTDMDIIYACTHGYIYKHLNECNVNITNRFDSTTICNRVAEVMGWHRDIDTNTPRGADLHYYWSPSAIKERCLNFDKVVRRRNDLINNNKSKLNAVLELTTVFTDKTTIIFNQSVEFADIVTNAINSKKKHTAICYHSKIETRYMQDEHGNTICSKNGSPKKFGKTVLKRMAIEGLKDGTYDTLVTVMALDTGMDIPNINLAILTSGTINSTQYDQRKGRSFRIDELNKEDVVIIFNLYMKSFDTKNADGENVSVISRDATKLFERQKLNTSHIIDINTLTDIEYLYKI